tara:strand:+ start:486 stop:824 length:339 start_codon:yes stop_codon:yes gene_type:complete
MWAGNVENDNTDWQQSPIGSNAVRGALHMGCIDVVPDTAAGSIVFDFGDANTPTAVTDLINPTKILSLLSVVNVSDSAAGDLVNISFTDTTIKFDSDTGGDGDTHRLTFLYR